MNSGAVNYRPFDEMPSPASSPGDGVFPNENNGTDAAAHGPLLPLPSEKLSVAEVMRDQLDLLAHYQVLYSCASVHVFRFVQSSSLCLSALLEVCVLSLS